MQASQESKNPQSPTEQAQDVKGQASHAAATPLGPAKPQPSWFGVGWFGMIVVILAAGLGGYWFSQRMDRVETSAARRLQGADQRIVQLEAQTKLYQVGFPMYSSPDEFSVKSFAITAIVSG